MLGTCGWSYAEWEDSFYFRKQGKLKQYSSIFPTVEINSTFYALPKPEVVLGWNQYTPQDFIFSAKLPQIITHKKTIDVSKGVEADINQFLEVMRPLISGKKLWCILVQLPPFLKFNNERLESFLSLLPTITNFAMEFRHTSWLRKETFRLLDIYHVAYTIVDEPLLPPEVHITSDIAYFRWHGRGSRPWFNYKYSKEEVEEWVPRVTEVAGKTKRVLGYFNNHFHAYAPENCLQIMQMLGINTEHSDATLRRMNLSRKDRSSSPVETLEIWTGPISDKKVENMLQEFGSGDIIKKAKSIQNKEFSLREDSKRGIAAYIADTTVDIDVERQTIIHYCTLWGSLSLEKKFCPHIVKLFLDIDSRRAVKILSQISSTLDNWKFDNRLAVEFPG